MARPNPLDAIIEKKSRAYRHDYAAWSELATLHSGFCSLSDPAPYQISIHVIAIAACIEAFCKSCIKNLVDHESGPYLERAKKIDMHFDFDLTRALSRKEITFGDLVSHSVGISSVEQIIKHFDVLFKGDIGYTNFKTCLANAREFVEPSEESIMAGLLEHPEQLGELILSDADSVINDLKDVFKARHIAAHEANFSLVTLAQLLQWFESAMTFANATYEILEQRIRPGASRNAFGSSVQALQHSGELISTINEATQNLVCKWQAEWNLDENVVKELWLEIKSSEQAFSDYVDKEITVQHRRVGIISGNGYRHLEATIRRKLYELRLAYLNDLLAER